MGANGPIQPFQLLLALHDHFHRATFLGYAHDEAVLGGGQYFGLDELDGQRLVVG